MTRLSITVVGAGIVGLWQAYELASRGHDVTLREAMAEADAGSASRCAGAMLAPYCEAESAPPLVRELGLRGLERWRQVYHDMATRGTLVVAPAHEPRELVRFGRMTAGHETIDAGQIRHLEAALSGKFTHALYYPNEAHVAPRAAMTFLISQLRRLGVELRFGDGVPSPLWRAGELVIDCRGIAAASDLADLRGVRGEMVVVNAPALHLTRPVRLLHPRLPLYVVPWGDGLYMIGATMIERDDLGPATLRSALELLTSAIALFPGLADATITELWTGVRPAFLDNVPRISIRGRRILVNGAYRHGFLLAPVLAEAVAEYIETGEVEAMGLPVTILN